MSLAPATRVWSLSAGSAAELRQQAQRLRDHRHDSPKLDPGAVAYSLAMSHDLRAHRGVVVGNDRALLLQGLDALAQGEYAATLVHGHAWNDCKVVFVFPGQGSQWPRMAVELLDSSPAFGERLQACTEALAPFVDWSLENVLYGRSGAPALDRADVVQPALFAVMVSLAEVWKSFGVEPAAVIGHSMGEIAAACVAGGLSLDDGARVVALWSKAQAQLSGKGDMASIPLPHSELAPRLSRWNGRVAIAAINGPAWTTVSGESEAVQQLVDELIAEGVRARMIAVGLAAHSPQIDNLREQLAVDLSPLTPHAGALPFYSTLTGELLDTSALEAGYWARSLRQTVQFERAMRSLLDQGHNVFIEISPHPV